MWQWLQTAMFIPKCVGTMYSGVSILESECEIATNWFKDNHMIVNPGKFQALIFDKREGNPTNHIINIWKKLKRYQKLNF